jgi:hypothetical protein
VGHHLIPAAHEDDPVHRRSLADTPDTPDSRAARRAASRARGAQTGRVTPAPRGVVRLLNTSAGPVLCLAGEVDAATVDTYLQRYGREPMPVGAVDAGSVTGLSMPAVDLVLDHLDAAERAGRQVRVRRSPVVERLLGRTAG